MQTRKGTISAVSGNFAEVVFEDVDQVVTAKLPFGFVPVDDGAQPTFAYTEGDIVVCVRFGDSWSDGVILCKVGG